MAYHIRNFTPHEVVLELDNGVHLALPSEGMARASQTTEQIDTVQFEGAGSGSIPLTESIFGEVENLPDYEPGVLLLVSSLTAQAAPERDDLVIPADVVRDDQGRPAYWRALGRI